MQIRRFFLLLLLLLMSLWVAPLKCFNATAAKADVGVILDYDTTVGMICKTCISMAIEDFYSNRDHSTVIVPHFMDSRSNIVASASAAIHLLKNTKVMVILGPQKSIQADFVIDVGDEVKVPIISPATSPFLSPKESPYFVRSAWCSSSQVKALAAIIKKFGWREIIFVYEDTNYGSGLLPFLIEELLKVNALISYQSVVSPVANNDQIRLELCKLMKMRTKVFIVHMPPSLASRFFVTVKETGMMDKGYAWIIADVLTSLLDSMDSKTIEAMQGVLGVKSYIQQSDEVINFTRRWSKRFHKENPDMYKTELNVFGLWAYDSTTALAEAIERVGVASPQINRSIDSGNLTDFREAIGMFNAGPSLLRFIRNHVSKGLTGDFNISNGQLQASAFEIVNVNGKREVRVGFWTEQCGILKTNDHQVDCPRKEGSLDPIVWPGKTNEVPKGWDITRSGKILRAGVPAKAFFSQFVKVEINEETNGVEATGFSIDVFEVVMKSMPYAVLFEYVPYEGHYDDLVEQISLERFDVVVGDVTVTARRSNYADFTIPYVESGVVIVVPFKHDERKNAWVFMKPLTPGLWLTIGAFFVFTGFVVWILEHRMNEEFRGPPMQQAGMIFWFSFSTLVFAHKEKVMSNLTRFVVIVWVFVVLVLTSSYTASLTSMLTVVQLQPKINDIYDLMNSGEYVGYGKDSFVGEFLTNSMKFDSSMLKSYSTLEEFDDALSKGSKNGGVGAVVEELLYVRLIISKYCDKYTITGPTYPTSGLGFAFPKGSPLVPDFSREILKLKESELMVRISNKWLGEAKGCANTNGPQLASQSLNLDSFKGLFLIAGLSSSIALTIFLSTFLYENRHILTSTASTWEKLYGLAKIFSGEEVESKESPTPAVSIPFDQRERFPQERCFSSVEIAPTQLPFPPQEASS